MCARKLSFKCHHSTGTQDVTLGPDVTFGLAFLLIKHCLQSASSPRFLHESVECFKILLNIEIVCGDLARCQLCRVEAKSPRIPFPLWFQVRFGRPKWGSGHFYALKVCVGPRYLGSSHMLLVICWPTSLVWASRSWARNVCNSDKGHPPASSPGSLHP